MPTTVPVVRKELAASGTVTDWKLKRGYVQVAPGMVVPAPEGFDPTDHGGFGVDCVTRAWAHHLVRPDAVVAGWAAAGLYGLLPDWCDSAPVLLLCGVTSHGSTRSTTAARHPVRPVIRPRPAGLETRRPSRRFPGLRVVAPQVAAVHCLWTILTGRHTWWVHDVPGLRREEVRAVQFIDAFCQCTWVTRAQLLEAARGTIDRGVMEGLLALADDGAQSPMETVMRLIVRDVLAPPHRWQSQIRVDLAPGAVAGWTPRTLPDLGCEELRLALYYDGGHHGTARQTDVDFDQFHALRDLDWEALRFTKESIRSPAVVQERVGKARDRALRRMRSLEVASPAPPPAEQESPTPGTTT
ncbi:DUF559 domain-containing protein [Corynebacterium sp. USCH3]|uniref:DUF559 domain-containing protein n=1 Tax=Corynebacterium sp. USCH3 TaxID=3024840 RepID=UPI0030A8C57E